MARGATAENYQDQRHESPLGRLFLSGGLGDPKKEQAQDRYESGQWWWQTYHDFRHAISARKPFASLPSPSSESEYEDEEKTRRTVARYNNALQRIPVLSRSALMEVVICQNEEPSPGMLRALMPALDALTIVRMGT